MRSIRWSVGSWTSWAIATISAGLLFGCGGPREVESLIDLEAWTVVSGSASDPFSAAAIDPTCDLAATGFELFGGEPSFGIDTERCGYVTVEQPSKTNVEAGDLLHFRLWHFELSAAEPATTRIALALDGRTVHELELAIPGPSGLDAPYFEAQFDVAEGAPVHFHLQNHGSNSYALLELTVGGVEP